MDRRPRSWTKGSNFAQISVSQYVQEDPETIILATNTLLK
jgi:hypothetical protein